MKMMAMLSLLGALICASSLADELTPTPTLQFAGCINGKVSVWLGASGSATNHWFQVKDLDTPSSDWQTVDFTPYPLGVGLLKSFGDTLVYHAPVSFSGAALFRVADTNAAGEHSPWLEIGPVTNYLRHVSGITLFGSGNGLNTYWTDGKVMSIQEAAAKHQNNSTNLVFGIKSSSPLAVSMIRYVPRQDDLGLARFKNVKFQCADDDAFTSPVELGQVPANLESGRVLELVIDPPVTAKCFRLLRQVATTNDTLDYVSLDEMEFVRADINPATISATISSDITNGWPSITWSSPSQVSGQSAYACNTGVLQRALSPAGPFTDVGEWTDAVAGETVVDKGVAVGPTYYYRVLAQCVAGGHRGFMTSDLVKFVRGRRLERDPEDLSALRAGVAMISDPLAHLGERPDVTITGKSGLNTIAYAFDGKTNTTVAVYCYTNTPAGVTPLSQFNSTHRYFNPAVGVDLGAEAAYHIVGTYLIPRAGRNTNIYRPRNFAIFGANETDYSDRKQLSAKLGGFQVPGGRPQDFLDDPQYNMTTNMADKFRLVFLMAPDDYPTYGEVAEVGFYGFSDQDIIDSGVLVPPPTVSCVTNISDVTLSWEQGWNAEAYVVERRKAGSDDGWTQVASLETNALAYVDGSVPRSGTWEWRITAVAEGKDPISSLSCIQYFDPHRGMTIIFR